MRFGTARQLPGRLRAARTIVYCQAAVVAMVAAFMLEFMVINGPDSGFPLAGIFTSTTVTGTGLLVLALAHVIAAMLLVLVEQRASVGDAKARGWLIAAEVAIAVYLIGFVATTGGSWIFGPAAAMAILALHEWPALRRYFSASDGGTLAAAGSDPAGTAVAGSDPSPTSHSHL